MKRAIVAIWSVVVFGNIVAWSQNTISGHVTDEEGKGIEFASVRLMTTDSVFVVGGATDGKGYFGITTEKNGTMVAIISALGYEKKILNVTIESPMTEMPLVSLRKDSRTLGEVTVKGQAITRVDGYLQIIPDKMSVEHSFTGYQLLNNLMLPGFEVDPQNGTVKLYGNNVSLFINGVPAEFRMIQNLRPKDVEKIEYHDVPTGRYATCFAAINFITKRQTTGGYVTVDAQQRIGANIAGQYNGYAQVNKGQTKYYVYGGYENLNGNGGHYEENESFDLSSSSVRRKYNSVDDRERYHTAYGNLQIQSNHKKGYIFTNIGVVKNLSVSDNGGEMNYTSQADLHQFTRTRKTDNALSPRFRFSTMWNISENQFLFAKVTGAYGRNSYNYSYDNGEAEILTQTKERMYNASIQATYDIKFRHNNHLAIIALDEFRNSQATYDGANISNQRLWTLNGAYLAEYDHKFSRLFRFNAQLGLSAVNMLLKGYSRQDFYAPIVYTRLIYSPAARHQLTFQLMAGQMAQGLSVRTDAEQPIDMIMTRRGNPTLKNKNDYSFKIRYNGQVRRFMFGANFAFDYSHNSVLTGYSTEQNRLILSFYNGNMRTVAFYPSVTWVIMDNLRANFTGNVRYMGYTGPNGRKTLSSGLARLELMYFLHDFSFGLSGITPERNLGSSYNVLSIPFQYSLNMGWNHGNWYIGMWARNIFHRQHTKENINVEFYEMERNTWFKRYATIKVAYTFDFGKKVKREQRKIDTSIDSNILK